MAPTRGADPRDLGSVRRLGPADWRIWRELMGASHQAQAQTDLVLAPSDQPE